MSRNHQNGLAKVAIVGHITETISRLELLLPTTSASWIVSEHPHKGTVSLDFLSLIFHQTISPGLDMPENDFESWYKFVALFIFVIDSRVYYPEESHQNWLTKKIASIKPPTEIENNGFKGTVQRKLRWVKSGINR
jgi:hypothetical protein